MAIKKILQSKITGGSDEDVAILTTKASEINVIDDEGMEIIQDLRDTMWAYPFCVGLSAPQIGISKAISVVNSTREKKEDDLILINPEIISVTGKKDIKRESCMSVWGEQGEVQRRSKLKIKYRDIHFEEQTLQCEGFLSRAIQHELDHLQGVLYCDIILPETELSHATFFDAYELLEE